LGGLRSRLKLSPTAIPSQVPQVSQVGRQPVAIFPVERVMIDYVLQIIYCCIQFLFVPFAFAERPVKLGQMPLREIDPLHLPPLPPRQLDGVSQICLGLTYQSASTMVIIPLRVDRQHQTGNENQSRDPCWQSTKRARPGWVQCNLIVPLSNLSS